MNIHELTWTALGCRPKSTCKASAKHLPAAKTWGTCKSVYSLLNRTDHVGVTTMKRLDQDHLHPISEVQGLTCPDQELNPGLRDREHSRKETFEQPQFIDICNIYIWVQRLLATGYINQSHIKMQVQIRPSYWPLGFSLGVCLQNGYSEEENVRYAQQMAWNCLIAFRARWLSYAHTHYIYIHTCRYNYMH